MPARRIAMLLATCALVAPASAHAIDPAPTAPPTGGTAAPEPDPALATTHAMVRKVAVFRGTIPDAAGRTVTIERLDPETATWVPLTSAPVADDGTYVARWRADVAGRMTTRANVGTPSESGAALALTSAPESSLTVYRPALATWYGPGFYGRKTACGQRMTRRLLGVAHKRLPCGTQVALAYEGRTITVPVVDRGPFAKGRKWDLTAATAKALDFTYTDRIGAVPVG